MTYDVPPPASPVLLSIIIVNFNGERFVRPCLESIRDLVTCQYEVIFVDNASEDDSCGIVRREFPWVNLIESKVNTGFTGGNNAGALVARGDLLLLLNNDTVLQTDVQAAIDHFRDHMIGIVGVRLRYADGRQQPSVGFEHTPWRIALSWLGLAKVAWLPSVFRRSEVAEGFYALAHRGVAWVSGAALLTRKNLWDSLRGLDEDFFMYVEDIDYCRRARDMGYCVVYEPSVLVLHHEGAGRRWIGEQALLRTMRSYKVYTRKHYGAASTCILSICLWLVMLARSLVYGAISVLSGDRIWYEKRRGYFAAAVEVLQSRIHVQS